jgi:NAD(P)H-hydrate epimerase
MPAFTAKNPIRHPLLTAEQVRTHERCLLAAGETAYGLMTQAGTALWGALRARWPQAQRIGVLLGSGQNAGDGLILARLARAAGCSVVLFGWFNPAYMQGACAQAWAAWQADYVEGMQTPDTDKLAEIDVIVDAGFGIGLAPNRPILGAAAQWITAVNGAHQQGVGVISADVPSGLAADTGAGDLMIHADVTVCFLAFKLGLFTRRGAAVAGKVIFADLNQPAPVGTGATQLLLSVPPLPAKPRDGHKGSFGCVLVIAGNQGMADALVLGPGLGRDDWAQSLAMRALSAPCPKVVDADGLYFLARFASQRQLETGALIITPHPAEAAQLLSCTTQTVEYNRPQAARDLAQRFGALTVLKGAGSVLALPDGLLICGRGSPALATAGSGDVLAGVVGGLLAVRAAAGLDLSDVLMRAVCWHAIAGELVAAEAGAWGAAATDLLPFIRALANGSITPPCPNEGLGVCP